MASLIDSDMYVNGNLAAKQLGVPNGTITQSMMAPNTGSGQGILASGVQQQYVLYSKQDNNTTPVARTEVIHVVIGQKCNLQSVKFGLTVACTGSDSVVVDLKKNGTSVLSGPVTLNLASGTTPQAGTITTPAAVAGDIITFVVTTVTGTSMKGLYAQLVPREDAQ
jgi:hypothetical protein